MLVHVDHNFPMYVRAVLHSQHSSNVLKIISSLFSQDQSCYKSSFQQHPILSFGPRNFTMHSVLFLALSLLTITLVRTVSEAFDACVGLYHSDFGSKNRTGTLACCIPPFPGYLGICLSTWAIMTGKFNDTEIEYACPEGSRLGYCVAAIGDRR